jgi:hypothetical protein
LALSTIAALGGTWGCGLNLGDFFQQVWVRNETTQTVYVIEETPTQPRWPGTVEWTIEPGATALTADNGSGPSAGWVTVFDELCRELGRADLPRDKHVLVVVRVDGIEAESPISPELDSPNARRSSQCFGDQ